MRLHATQGTFVAPEGELDLATGAELRASLHRWRTRAVVVDLRGITFVDLAGMQAVVATKADLEDRNVAVTVIAGESLTRLLAVLASAGVKAPLDVVAEITPEPRTDAVGDR